MTLNKNGLVDKSFLPAAGGGGVGVRRFDRRPFRAQPTMLSTLRHRGGKRKVGESGAAAEEGPDDGVKMLQRLLDVARPKQATSRSLADTLELVVEEWSVHAAEMQGDTYEIVGGEARANAKKNLRRALRAWC